MKVKVQVRNADELAQRIAELEAISHKQKRDIQQSFGEISENLKPVNLLRNGFKSVFSGANEHKGDIFNALLGVGSGFISRKLFFGKSTGFLGKTVGKAIQWGMAGLVSKNAEKIKEKAGDIIDKVFKKNTTSAASSNHTPERPVYKPDALPATRQPTNLNRPV